MIETQLSLPGTYRKIGPYHVIRELGEGGMGRVYLAERPDLINRLVAIKVLKPGIGHPAVIARFRYEQKTLAKLDHPYIARVFDSGVSEDGRPYFVMEYVEGETITHWCNEKKLTIRERLQLLVRVADGVAHAHKRGIIHRDLKPANIMITEVNGKPWPKIIDFGISKALDLEAPVSHSKGSLRPLTNTGHVLGTLGYMSPEQASGSSDLVDTRSDVYALGALAYELFTGRPPFMHEQLNALPFAVAIMKIRSEDPEHPSQCIRTEGPYAQYLAENRSTTPTRLKRELEGELNWLVMHALEREKDRRYGSAEAFAEDIHRYLQNRPIIAGPPSRLYTLRKFVQRNLLQVGLTALLLVVGLFGTMRTNLAESRAIDQGRKAEQTLELMTNFLVSAGPRGEGKDPKVSDLLKDFLISVDQAEYDDPEIKADLYDTIGQALTGYGQPESALPAMEKALQLRKQTRGPNHRKSLQTRLELAKLQAQCRQREQAKYNLDYIRDHYQSKNETRHLLYLAATTELGMIALEENNTTAAQVYLRSSAETFLQSYGLNHPRTLEQLPKMIALYRNTGNKQERFRFASLAFEAHKQTYGLTDPRTLPYLLEYVEVGIANQAQAQISETINAVKSNLDQFESMPKSDNQIKLFKLLRDMTSRDEETSQWLRLSEAIMVWKLKNGPRDEDNLAEEISDYLDLLISRGQEIQAEQFFNNAVKQAPDLDDQAKLHLFQSLGIIYLEKGKSETAKTVLKEAQNLYRRIFDREAPYAEKENTLKTEPDPSEWGSS